MDLDYIAHRSVLLDFKVICKTPMAMIHKSAFAAVSPRQNSRPWPGKYRINFSENIRVEDNMKVIVANYRFFVAGGPERYMFNFWIMDGDK